VLQREPAIQRRLGVRKDFWIPKDGERRHLTMQSGGSELILIDRNGKFEATELLQDVDGEFVEKGERKCFKAAEGTYFYPSHRFIANEAEFCLFRNGAPLLQGTAQKANCSFIAKCPLLTADQIEFQNGE